MDFMFFLCAGIGGTIMVLQFLLTLLGLGDDGALDGIGEGGMDADFDADFEADHNTSMTEAADADIHGSTWLFEVLSLRSIIAGLAFFGLGGMFARASDWAATASLLLACTTGAAGIYATFWVMQQLYKLKASGTVNIKNAKGKTATIYVPIPGENAGRGKVHLTIQGRTMEYEAVTNDKERLATGETVVVAEAVGSDLVRVTKEKD